MNFHLAENLTFIILMETFRVISHYPMWFPTLKRSILIVQMIWYANQLLLVVHLMLLSMIFYYCLQSNLNLNLLSNWNYLSYCGNSNANYHSLQLIFLNHIPCLSYSLARSAHLLCCDVILMFSAACYCLERESEIRLQKNNFLWPSYSTQFVSHSSYSRWAKRASLLGLSKLDVRGHHAKSNLLEDYSFPLDYVHRSHFHPRNVFSLENQNSQIPCWNGILHLATC